jgi:hypothetical protein
MKSMLCLILWGSVTVSLAASETDSSLEGLVIQGQLKATNSWLRVGVQGSITVRDGRFIWSTGKHKEQVQSLPYQLTPTSNCLLLTAEGPAEPGSADVIHWQACVDEAQLSNVTARWTRVEKDFIHDLMLPDVVYFSFKPKQENHP